MNEKTTAFILSFVSGFVDTAGFIALGGVFTAHVTGNFVLAGASIVRSNTEGIFVKLIMFPIFVAAVGATYLISCALEKKHKNALFYLMILEAIFLFAFAVTGFYFQPTALIKMTESQVILTGALGVIAMAIQNSYMKQHLGHLSMTTVMTGNVTQFSTDLTKLIFGVFHRHAETESSSEIGARMKKVGSAILGFLFGAIGGAVLFINFGLLAGLLPFALVLITAFGQVKATRNHQI